MRTFFELSLAGAFDEREVSEVPVTGELPAWLNGALIRNGPGGLRVGAREVNHWFDGLAMLQRFEFAGSRVTHASRYLRTRTLDAAQRAAGPAYREFATDPAPDLAFRLRCLIAPRSALGVNPKAGLARLAGQWIALGETPTQMSFNPRTLAALDTVQFAAGDHIAGSHPHVDDARGEAVYFSIHLGRTSHYHFTRLGPALEPKRIARIAVDRPAYVHSFALTERRIVLAEFPLVLDPVALLLARQPYIACYAWAPERGTRFTVIDRNTGAIEWRAEAAAMFALHQANAWEDGDDVVLSLAAYDSPDILEAFSARQLSAGVPLPTGRLRHIRLSPGRPAHVEAEWPEPIEFPRIDARRARQTSHVTYGCGVLPHGRAAMYDAIVKLDARSGAALRWSAPNCYPAEPVFVPGPGAPGEDAGVLLTVVLDVAHERSFLAVLDARDLHEIARATLPWPLPLAFHGEFWPHITQPTDA